MISHGYVVLAVMTRWLCDAGCILSPLQGPEPPFWINPCGLPPTIPVHHPLQPSLWGRQQAKSWRKVRLQLKAARQHLDYAQFNQLYMDVREGIEDRQYIPNWLPNKKEMQSLVRESQLSQSQISQHLPTLYTGLQKFAVAFEQVLKDEEIHLGKIKALESLIFYLRLLLCEVESAMLSLDWLLPKPIGRDIIASSDSTSLSYTHRIIRDNGVLLKYRIFLDMSARLTRFKPSKSKNVSSDNKQPPGLTPTTR